MDELIYSTRQIFTEYLRMEGCEFFNIPEYQRGYKWSYLQRDMSEKIFFSRIRHSPIYYQDEASTVNGGNWKVLSEEAID